jgi:putative oxidoreductase
MKMENELDLLLILGRVLFGALWIGAGFGHFKSLEAMTGYAKYKKLPAAKLGVIGSGLTFLVGGILIVLGTWIDLAALLIAVTVILAAIIFHQYWKETDANTKMQEMMAFNKDMALGGAALILFALVAGGLVTEFGPSVGAIALFG